MNKWLYLGLSILEISEIVTTEFQYDYEKLKYGEKAKLCYMDTGSFIVFTKTKDIYVDNAKDIKTRFYASIYELDKSLPKGKNKEIILLI